MIFSSWFFYLCPDKDFFAEATFEDFEEEDEWEEEEEEEDRELEEVLDEDREFEVD